MALILFSVLGFVAVVYLWRVWLWDHRRPRSWLLLVIALASSLVEAASLGVAVLAYRRLTGHDPLPHQTLIVAGLLIVLEAVPSIFAYTIWRIRHRKLPNRPVVEDGP